MDGRAGDIPVGVGTAVGLQDYRRSRAAECPRVCDRSALARREQSLNGAGRVEVCSRAECGAGRKQADRPQL